MNEDKAARYHRLRRRALVLAAGWTTCLLGGVLLSRGGHALGDYAHALARHAPLPDWAEPAAATALFTLVLLILHECGVLPAAYYLGHALDRRYGLSRRSRASWLRTHAKSAALGWLLTVLAACGVMTALQAWPHRWWLAVWAASACAGLLGAWLMPVALMPLFYRITRLSGPIECRLIDLARRAGVPVVGVYAWHAGAHTSRANAALAGLGHTRRILVSDTLLSGYSDDEVDVVLAHEMSHHVHHDIWRFLALDALIAGLSLWIAHLALGAWAAALGLRGTADLAGLLLVALSVTVVPALCLPGVNGMSRVLERRADRFALDLTSKPDAFVSAIRRLAAHNLADDDPSALTVWLFDTHPSVKTRLTWASQWAGRAAR